MKNGEVVHVVMVPKQYAKCIKTTLEQHQLMNRNFRISNTVVVTVETGNNKEKKKSDDNYANKKDEATKIQSSLVAIPIRSSERIKSSHTHSSTTTTTTDTDHIDTNLKNIHDDSENHLETLVSNIIHSVITTTPIDDTDVPQQQQQKEIVVEFRHQFCFYSSRIMGNNNCYPHSNLNHRSLTTGNINHHQNITIVQSILIHAISNFLSKNETQHYTVDIHDDDTTVGSTLTNHKVITSRDNTNHTNNIMMDGISDQEQQLFHDVTVRLSTETCPPKLELLGDDRTIVLPRKALQYYSLSSLSNPSADRIDDTCHAIPTGIDDDQDKSHHTKMLSFPELLQQYGITSDELVDVFLKDYLWCDMAQTFHSHRIVRRDEIHPHSPTRQSNYQIVWYDPNYYNSDDTPLEHHENTSKDTDANVTKQKQSKSSCYWITVTEQGIRQSFDMTKVMFSRGNITEKIRYGTQLVQKDELILDMYAGIGYFTLPALIHGQAKHVYCCEWNPDAIAALRYNLHDNHVSDRATIFEGDCRITIQRNDSVLLQNRFDRICLGLLPSSEGGWSSAILALRKDIGGWLHIHGNVPHKEVHEWSQWLSQSLKTFLLDRTVTNDSTLVSTFCDWIVLVVHVEKVKSFAPNVNHYVADVFVGPYHCFPGKNVWPANLPKDCFSQCLLDNPGDCCMAGVVNTDKRCIELCTMTEIIPPSCVLSPNGPLHQTWMSSY